MKFSREQRVEVKKNEIQCSICIEDLSKNHANVIEMPKCLHRFHQDCLRVTWSPKLMSLVPECSVPLGSRNIVLKRYQIRVWSLEIGLGFLNDFSVLTTLGYMFGNFVTF